MNSSYVNMGMASLLVVLLVFKTASLASAIMFAKPAPERPGFKIVAAEPQAPGVAPIAAEPPQSPPIGQRLQQASAEAGATIFKKCQACHDATKGGPNKVGPNLFGIVDRPVATHPGFSYSAALKAFSKAGTEHWTFDHLDHFLAGPKAFVPGTAMSFSGLSKNKDRADVIAYLRTLSDNPVPLPDGDKVKPK